MAHLLGSFTTEKASAAWIVLAQSLDLIDSITGLQHVIRKNLKHTAVPKNEAKLS